MRSRFGCTAYLIIGALALAVGALAYALAGTMTIALANTFSMVLTNVLLVGVVALGAGGVSLSLMLRNPSIKQLLISGLARRFHLPEPKPLIDPPVTPQSLPVMITPPQITARQPRRFIDPRVVEGWFKDAD
jgi:hypothetical protein